MAFATWAGAELPTESEWYRAALGDGAAPFPWGTDGGNVAVRANFGFAGTETVGSHPLGVSPFGVLDMAGNVREWVADETPGSARRRVVGGSWRDPAYMFERNHAEGFDPDTEGGTIGFRLLKRIPNEH
jgi:formylglycine-generating enzyme required for sulfatase activity